MALQLVSPAFDDPGRYTTTFLVAALYGYTLQIYMDLSGYTDIARGIAKMLGFELPRNFDRPYLAATLSNFWQRWHISMSSFFRDYLFFGLGGSRHGNVYRNLMITFIAIGAWHGAGWNFILYGALHAGMVCIERMRRDAKEVPDTISKGWGISDWWSPRFSWILGVLFTFHFVVLTRLLFRADDLSAAGNYVHAMTSASGTLAPWAMGALGALMATVLLHLVPARVSDAAINRMGRTEPFVQGCIVLAALFIVLVGSAGEAPFIYFEF